MKFTEFLKETRDAFYKAVINAVGSTTFWMTIITVIIAALKIVPWETVLMTAGIFGLNRVGNTVSTNLGGK